MIKEPYPLGFVTNIFSWEGETSFENVVRFAVENDFPCIELGPTFNLGNQLVEQVLQYGLQISNFIYCRNLLSSDTEAAETHTREVMKRIDLASEYEVPLVTISAGIIERVGTEVYDSYEAIRPLPARSMESFLTIYSPIFNHAEKRDVKVTFEICPLMGNWAISPELWKLMFDRVGSSVVGLTYDPSHLVWQFIDPYDPIEEFGERIFHIHAKDTEIDWRALKRKGILTDFSWWIPRIPGWGDLNWTKIYTALRSIGYNGRVSIEHEDPRFQGSLEKVKEGILAARDYLIQSEQMISQR